MKFLVTFRPNWWIIGAIFEEICIYVEENEGFGQPLIPFILLIGELQMGPYMVTYWCVSECCSLIGSHRLYVYRNVMDQMFRIDSANLGSLFTCYEYTHTSLCNRKFSSSIHPKPSPETHLEARETLNYRAIIK